MHTIQEYSSRFDMQALFSILRHYNDLNMTGGMRARVQLQFYGRNMSYKTIFYLPKVLDRFFDKDDHVMYL